MADRTRSLLGPALRIAYPRLVIVDSVSDGTRTGLLGDWQLCESLSPSIAIRFHNLADPGNATKFPTEQIRR